MPACSIIPALMIAIRPVFFLAAMAGRANHGKRDNQYFYFFSYDNDFTLNI